MLRALAASSGGPGGWVAAATVALDAKVILTPPLYIPSALRYKSL
jgi:hypothetical protein